MLSSTLHKSSWELCGMLFGKGHRDPVMKSKRIMKYGIALGVLCLLIIAAAVIVPKLIDLNRYRGWIVSEVEKAIDGEVHIGRISWGVANGLTVKAEEFSIINSALFPVDFSIERISARIALLPLFVKTVIIKNLDLSKPVVTVRLTPERFKAESTRDKDTDSSSAPAKLPVDIAIENITLDRGLITIEDAISVPGQKKVYVLDKVMLVGANLTPGEEMRFKVAFEDTANRGLGALKAEGEFRGLTKDLSIVQPVLTGKAWVSGFDVDAVKPYLKNHALSRKIEGNISLEVNYAGDLGRHFTANGTIDLSKLSYTDPTLWEKPLQHDAASIDYHFLVDPDRIHAEKLDLHLGNLKVKLGVMLDNRKSKPTIKNAVLSGDLPLKEIIPFVPWKLLKFPVDIIRSILEGGGYVRIDRIDVPRLVLNPLPQKRAPMLDQSKGTVQFIDVSIQPHPTVPRIERMSGRAILSNGVLHATIEQAKFGPVALPTLHARVTHLGAQPKVIANARGPVRFPGKDSSYLDEYFMRYGLTRLIGKADIDLTAQYDTAEPGRWQAKGSASLDKVNADFESKGVRLTDLRGGIRFRREKDMEVSFDNLAGRMNQSPFHIDGRVTGIGSPHLRIDTRNRIEQLNLAWLAVFAPELEVMGLAGILDADMNIDLSLDDPYQAQLGGFLRMKGISADFAEKKMAVREGYFDLDFAEGSIELRSLKLQLNGQELFIGGKAINPKAPQFHITVNVPNLNVDRLFPGTPSAKQTLPSDDEKPESKTNRNRLPDYAGNMSVQLHVDIGQGTYRQTDFKNLTLSAFYDKGVIENHRLTLEIADGRIQSNGLLDFRDMDHIQFRLKPAIESVHLEKLASLFQKQRFPVEGALSMSGHLNGGTGNRKGLLSSLNGRLSAELERGRVLNVGRLGSIIAKILSFTSLRGILYGDVAKNIAQKGVAFRHAELDADVREGVLQIKPLTVQGNALNAASIGDVDLVQNSLDLKVEVEPLGTINEVLGIVPILGKIGQKLTKIYLDVKGPFADPTIRVSPVRGLTEAVRQGLKATGDIVEGTLDSVEKPK